MFYVADVDMRLITMEMSDAVHSRRCYKKSNTEVIIDNNSNASVYLFENKIIQTDGEEVTYDSCGWKTNIAKERLNGLMPKGYTIIQRKSEWHISRNGNIVGKWEDGITNNEIIAMG